MLTNSLEPWGAATMQARCRTLITWAGAIFAVAGPSVTICAMAMSWHHGFGMIGIGGGIIGVASLMFGYLVRLTGTVGEIYSTGYDDGYEQGRREGRRLARPIVVDVDFPREGDGDSDGATKRGPMAAG